MRGSEFSEGEQAILFLGPQDPGDGSYDVSMGHAGRANERISLAVAVLAALVTVAWLASRRFR
jgi:hypothetical protein